MSENNKKCVIDLGDDFDVVVTANGVRIEIEADGSVKVTGASNDNIQTCGAASALSPEIGDVMPDGTIYAGMSPDTGEALYATPQDAPLLMRWGKATAYADDLDAHGHKDWRLPTLIELKALYDNRHKGALKGTFNEKARFFGNDGWYWSCTGHPGYSSLVYFVNFAGGGDVWVGKDFYELSVRPVRAEPRP